MSPEEDPVNNCGSHSLKYVPNTQAVCSLQVITLASAGGNLRSKSRTDPSPQPNAINAPEKEFRDQNTQRLLHTRENYIT